MSEPSPISTDNSNLLDAKSVEALVGLYRRYPVLDKGHVMLVRMMPDVRHDLSPDQAVVQAARASTTSWVKEFRRFESFITTGLRGYPKDDQLLRYLWSHGHTSCWEMVEFQFHVKAPLFIARQWMRHRTWNYNEMSGRYQEIPHEVYLPKQWYAQSEKNKQGSAARLAEKDELYLNERVLCLMEETWSVYEDLLRHGVSREDARIVLGLNTYTEFYAKVDAHNLIHNFIGKRDHHEAQHQMQAYAQALKQIVSYAMPLTASLAWGKAALTPGFLARSSPPPFPGSETPPPASS